MQLSVEIPTERPGSSLHSDLSPATELAPDLVKMRL